tara:strand:+ start:2511 stop:3506 length:996 start_codon:yes stop_codon:yes gene_type:complete
MAKKLSDKGSLTEQRIKEKKPVNGAPATSGLAHMDNWIDEVGAQYKNAPNEKIISKNGAFVVLGTDRPNSEASGYGAKGSGRSATIDLVVGRMSSARGGKGVKDGTFVDSNFAADAARIYISQQTDIDTNFGIVEGSIGNPRARSAIGIKADGVRIFGREGIKIVTGKGNNWRGFGLKGETNSLGGKISQPAPGIELIAGNNTEPRKVYGGLFNPREVIESLQPVAMGYNTRDAFRELSNILDDVFGALLNFALIQTSINTATAAAFASSGIYPPHGVAAGVIGTANTVGMPTQVLSPMYHARLSKTFDFEFNYLYPFGYKFICSRSVKTT